jgi:hypothetical protein
LSAYSRFAYSRFVCLFPFELALFCPLADWLFPTRFCYCRGFNEASEDLFV